MKSVKAPIQKATVLYFWGFCLVAFWHWQLWKELPLILDRDTLWHLSIAARVILVALSTCAVVATGLCCLVKSICFKHRFYSGETFRLRRWVGAFALDLATTFMLLWGAVSFAPQLFYMLYVTVIPGLPSRWVAKPVGWEALSEFLNLTPVDSMATLLVGVMMLSILVAGVIYWLSIPANLLKSKQ